MSLFKRNRLFRNAKADDTFLDSVLWMAPVDGELTALAVGDDTDASVGGSPAYQDGAVTAEGTIGMIRNGSSHVYFPNAGGPFEDISKSFWIAGSFRLTAAGSYECLCGNGAASAAQPGFRVRVAGGNSARIAIDIADGTTKVTKSFDHRRAFPVGTTESDIVSFVIEFKMVAGVPTVRVTIEDYGIYGSTASEATFTGLDMSVAGEPHLKGLVVGSYNESSTNAFAGDIVLQAGELKSDDFLTDKNRHVLGNYNRSRLYADAKAGGRDKVKYCHWFHKDGGAGFEFKVRSDESINVKVYDVATKTLQGSSGLQSSTNGFVSATVSSLTADQEVEIRFEDASGTVQHVELRGRVLPAADSDLHVATIGCANYEDDTNLGTHSSTFSLIRNTSTKPDLLIITEDFGYVDPTTIVLADYVARWDTIMADPKARYLTDHVPHIWGFGDHNFEDDGDSTSVYVSVVQQFARLALPTALAAFRDATNGVDYKVQLNGDYRILCMDTVTGKTDSVMMSAAAETWWKAQLAAANTAEEIVLNNWCKIIDFTGSVNSQKWKWYDTTFSSGARDQLNDLFDEIETVFGAVENHFVSLSGDVHLSGIDDGTNHGGYDTGADLNSIPTIHSSRWVHSVGENVANTAFTNAERNQQGNFGYLELIDSDTTVALAAKQFENTTQQGTTLNVTLTK